MAKSTPAKVSGHTGKSPRVMPCACKHEFQDSRYGSGKRLHNPRKSDKWACSVCGDLKEAK